MDNTLFVLAERLGRSLFAKGHKITTAESCTGGWLAQAITEVPGSSGWFDRGFVTYSNHSKEQMLAVKPETLLKYGAVSAEIVQQMAEGALARSEADWAVAITGIAGPEGGSQAKPVGTVYIAWQRKNEKPLIEKLQLNGSRHSIRLATVKRSLEGCLVLI